MQLSMAKHCAFGKSRWRKAEQACRCTENKADLKVALSEDSQADLLLIVCAKDQLQVFFIGQHALRHITEDCGGLQHFVKIFLPGARSESLVWLVLQVCGVSTSKWRVWQITYTPLRQLTTLFL